jgi:hypothetical protein
MRRFFALAIIAVSTTAHANTKYLSVEEWLYDATIAWQPAFSVKSKSVTESIEEHKERRRKIAASVWSAANDPSTPVLFSGTYGRQLTALFVLGIWKAESNFDIRVDKLHCVDLPKGSCDGGSAYCLGQIHPNDVPQLGYSGIELQSDNIKCARATIYRLSAAKAGTPKDANPADRFCGYATGHFESPCPLMRLRYSFASSWSKHHPVTPDMK